MELPGFAITGEPAEAVICVPFFAWQDSCGRLLICYDLVENDNIYFLFQFSKGKEIENKDDIKIRRILEGIFDRR